ncbi:50S ribosomal protein L25 [Chlamydiia bacterium]|nr:50S ribosomal protein L25 [Chlamydiia bacterium]
MYNQIKVIAREKAKKSHVGHIRNSGGIPAVLYGTDEQKERLLTVDEKDFKKFYSSLEKGHLPNTPFEIDLDGKHVVIVKGIEYNIINNRVIHLDLMSANKGSINIKVPLKAKGQDNCPGIVLGGGVRLIKRHVKVKTTLDAIPNELMIDVSGRELDSSIKVSEILPVDGVTIHNNANEVVAVIAKK